MEELGERINFYERKESFYEFSNFFLKPVDIRKKEWPSTEHFFQAMKFEGKPEEEKIRTAVRPGDAFRLGRSLPGRREDWEEVKEDYMLEALRAKFTQHADLKEVLLKTGSAYLSEHTKRDSYWGDGGDDSGKNRLGHLLMKVREELKEN